MKKLLVVSDNSALTSFFQELIKKETLKTPVWVDYAYSCRNSNPADLIALGASPVDLKSPAAIASVVENYHLIFSLHCKQIFPACIVNKIECVNLHPGLNPYNRGWYPQVFSIVNKKPIGATLHFMDEQVDHGLIISQEEIKVNEWDTSLDVYERVFEAEKRILKSHLGSILSGTATAYKAKLEGNYNSISDFRNLCELDINSVATMKEHIDLLRALTHGDFLNAYYLDGEGNKIFIKIEMIKSKQPEVFY